MLSPAPYKLWPLLEPGPISYNTGLSGNHLLSNACLFSCLKMIGLLLSGGMDSTILLASLLREGNQIQPIYIRSQLAWEEEEYASLNRLLQIVKTPQLSNLVTLEVPVGDLYDQHWSTTGEGVPHANTVDAAVFLPGRNGLLILKAGLWCQLHGIPRLALAVLRGNPFEDARPRFFRNFERVLNGSGEPKIEIIYPFVHFTKKEVMQLGTICPLEKTFSCISPTDGVHCGECNKCAERQRAFRSVEMPDLTRYANKMLV